MQNLNMGFNRGNILNLLHTRNLQGKGSEFKNELLKLDEVQLAGYANRLPPKVDQTYAFRPIGSGKEFIISVYEMDHDHLETMDYKITRGRFFSPDIPQDSTAVILNETAMKLFGWNDIENKSINSGYDSPNKVRRVIGVIQDFNFRTPRDPVLPLVVVLSGVPGWEMAIRIKDGTSEAALNKIETTWKKFLPHAPFEINLLDVNMERALKSERRTVFTFLSFTTLAIIIASLGLYGLANFMAEQRTKEIGIRKVVGGSITSITLLLNRQFLVMVLIGNILSYPFVIWYMNRWLEQFEYRVPLSITNLLITTTISVLIAVLSTTYKVTRAAARSPVRSLRSE
jgi:putative ABC transport system permease protein